MAFQFGGLCQLPITAHLVCSGQRSLGQNVLLVTITSSGVELIPNLVHKLLSVTIANKIEGIHCSCTV